jgi:hypothetical protein
MIPSRGKINKKSANGGTHSNGVEMGSTESGVVWPEMSKRWDHNIARKVHDNVHWKCVVTVELLDTIGSVFWWQNNAIIRLQSEGNNESTPRRNACDGWLHRKNISKKSASRLAALV